MEVTYADPADPAPRRLIIRAIERLTGERHLRRLYEAYDRRRDFYDAAVDMLDMRLCFSEQRLTAVPGRGPLLVVANHPFGITDGVAVTHLIGRRRDDLRIVAHGLLTRAPEAAGRILPIDFSGTRVAIQTNLATRRRAIEWLQQGGAVLIFPAGGVASAPSLLEPAIDDRWRPFAGRLIHATRCPVLPVYTAGQNSLLFQIGNLLHPTLRAALLLNEVRNKIGRRIEVVIGRTLPYVALAGIRDRQMLVDHLHRQVLALADDPSRGASEELVPIEAFL